MSQRIVLIVDDDPDCVELTKIALEKSGRYIVFSQCDPRQGVAYAKKLSPDIILLDIVMPHMSGLDVLSRLKKDKKTMHIPVIIFSSLADGCSKLEASRLYGDSYLEKPVNSPLLLETIEKILKP